MNIALIVFAGCGSRIHSEVPKQFIKVNGVDLVIHTIRKFELNPNIDEIVLVTNKEYVDYVSEYKSKYNLNKIKRVIAGGKTRQESVRLGLTATNYNENDNILIHDGDRPLISNDLINKCVNSLNKYIAVCPYILESDEIQGISNAGRKSTLNNKNIDIQTPQAFKYGLIKSLHLDNRQNEVNDDISLVNEKDVHFVLGEPINYKVTKDEDLVFLEKHLQ